MNTKRFASVVMAGTMALTMATPAFAASNNTTEITGTYQDIPIAVVVPTTGTAKINPYGLPVVLTKSDDSTVNLVGQQITHEVLAIRNQSDVDLDVNVSSFKVVPTGDLVVANTKNTGKNVKIDLQVAGLNDAKYAVAPDSDALEDALIDAFAANATWASAGTVGAPAATAANAATITGAKSNAALATLGAATIVDGDVTTYGNDSIALFRLKGDLAAEPVDNSSVADPWDPKTDSAAGDGFVATVVFKFTPTPSAGDAAVTVSISGTTATATFNAGTSGLTASSYAWTSATTSVATVSGSGTSGTITQDGGATAGQTSVITVTVTLSNGATVSGTATFTAT